jgi:hypothetical protein
MVDYIASDGYARACYYLCLVPDGPGRKQPCCSILMQGETSLHSQEQGPLYLNKPASDSKGHCDSARCLLNMTEQHLGSMSLHTPLTSNSISHIHSPLQLSKQKGQRIHPRPCPTISAPLNPNQAQTPKYQPSQSVTTHKLASAANDHDQNRLLPSIHQRPPNEPAYPAGPTARPQRTTSTP